MRNLISLILIFSSLAVIIFILGKKIPKLKDAKKNNEAVLPGIGLKKSRNIAAGILMFIKKSLVFLAEWIVMKAKKVLHLVHFWLIKIKRGKKENEELGELEAKQELIEEEEKNLERVINEDLADGQSLKSGDYSDRDIVFFNSNGVAGKPAEPEDSREEVADPAAISEEKAPDEEKKDKIEKFFTEETPIAQEEFQSVSEEKEKKGRFDFFKNIFKRKSEVGGNSDKETTEEFGEDSYRENERFSDGVVKVEKAGGQLDDPSNLIKEVVSVKKKKQRYADEDDELGVDRGILEKKIIGKISQNPKDIENYRQLGELYIKMKNYQDAQDAYKFILKVSPRDIDSKRKLEKIKLLKRISG